MESHLNFAFLLRNIVGFTTAGRCTRSLTLSALSRGNRSGLFSVNLKGYVFRQNREVPGLFFFHDYPSVRFFRFHADAGIGILEHAGDAGWRKEMTAHHGEFLAAGDQFYREGS
jgi:hypothetical protein